MFPVGNTDRNTGLDRGIFDAIPIPVFVIDNDAQILDLNASAAQFEATLNPGASRSDHAANPQRAGEVLHCIHSKDVPQGCGRGPACKSCAIRNSLADSLSARTVSRKRLSMQVLQGEKFKELQLIATVCPMPAHAERALLMVEDLTHLATLKSLIPICVKCKNVREDEEYWQTLESYVHEHMGVDFSHGVCPKCVNDFYPEYRRNEPREGRKMEASGQTV